MKRKSIEILGRIIGIIGLIDLIGMYQGFDLWGVLFEINLPELVRKIVPLIILGIGLFLLKSKINRVRLD